MKFRNDIHKNFYLSCLNRANNESGVSLNDAYHKALFYTLGLIDVNIDDFYDFRERKVKDFRSYEWITGTDGRIIRLAYHLFNGAVPTAYWINPDGGKEEEELKEVYRSLPIQLFEYLDSELLEFCFEAIRIRFEYV